MTPPAAPERYKQYRFPGEIISHDVWLYYCFPLSYRDGQELLFDRSIDNAIMRLRKKIEDDPSNPRIIKTVWGGGYVFAAEPRAA